jgi:hypothetical protein
MAFLIVNIAKQMTALMWVLLYALNNFTGIDVEVEEKRL